MKFLLIQLKNLLKLLAHLDAGNEHVVKKCVHAFFIHRIYNRIQKQLWVIKLKHLFAEGKGEIDE